jgi:hypothetical protein
MYLLPDLNRYPHYIDLQALRNGYKSLDQAHRKVKSWYPLVSGVLLVGTKRVYTRYGDWLSHFTTVTTAVEPIHW